MYGGREGGRDDCYTYYNRYVQYTLFTLPKLETKPRFLELSVIRKATEQ